MQKTAILGWGSLLWQPKELAFIKENDWNENGPFLPIEFARISKDGRLTLVITPYAKEVQTLYAISSHKTTEEAILNLAIREGSGRKSIGYYLRSNKEFSKDFEFKKNISNWIEKTDFDAVIWTNLGENWNIKSEKGEILKSIIPENRIEYLSELNGHNLAIAEEYIRKTPLQIETEYRKLIEEKLNWKPITR